MPMQSVTGRERPKTVVPTFVPTMIIGDSVRLAAHQFFTSFTHFKTGCSLRYAWNRND